MALITKINLLDVFFLILYLRICYVAISRGFFSELVRVTGIFLAGLVAFNYYSPLAIKLGERIIFLKPQYLNFICFSLLILVGNIIAALLSKIIAVFSTKEERTFDEKIFSLLMGLVRSVFLTSLIFFIFYLSPFNKNYISQGYAYRLFKNTAPIVYLAAVNFYSKFKPAILPNEEVKRYYDIKTVLSGSDKKGN